jgi:type II secretory pathway component PulJ
MMPIKRCARRGFSLIEVVVLMTAVAVVLGLCALTIQLLLRLNTDGQARYSASVTMMHLARQFRSDVRAGEAARLGASGGSGPKSESLFLSLGPEHSVAYEPRGESVVRLESQSGNLTRHERYALPRASLARFELREVRGRRFVALAVSRAAETKQAGPPRAWEVIALQGKDRAGPLQTSGGKPK